MTGHTTTYRKTRSRDCVRTASMEQDPRLRSRRGRLPKLAALFSPPAIMTAASYGPLRTDVNVKPIPWIRDAGRERQGQEPRQ